MSVPVVDAQQLGGLIQQRNAAHPLQWQVAIFSVLKWIVPMPG